MKKIELLAPAGDLERLKFAVDYGANAIYLGGQEYGLRSSSDNFTLDEIKEGVLYARNKNVDIYVTTNIYAHNENIVGFDQYVQQLEQLGVKGIIVSDPAFITIAKEVAPKLEIHISTQQSITNIKAAQFFEQMGADRIVLARELSITEIKEIVNAINIEVEVFLHGAVCSSYSGRCTLSNHMTMRDSNRGGCSQSCRWNFDLIKKEKNEYKNVVNPDQDLFTMSAKDMNLINQIPELIESGVTSLKIEGRMKSLHYLSTVVNTYRYAIDMYLENKNSYKLENQIIKELQKAESRNTNSGAFFGDFSEEGQIYGEQYELVSEYYYCGKVINYDENTKMATIEQRNHFKVGQILEFFGPNNSHFHQKIDIIYNENKEKVQVANHPLMIVEIKLDKPVTNRWLVRAQIGEK